MYRSRKNATASKALILIAVIFGLKTLAGCFPHHNEKIEFSYNRLQIDGIDNSGEYTDTSHPTDTLMSNAVAILLTLSDSTDVYRTASITKKINELFTFEPAYAMDVVVNYIPVTKVESIQITTLTDIDSNIRAGDDVTSYFLYASNDNPGLYRSLDDAIDHLNGIQSYPAGYVILVLTRPVQNTNAQFQAKVRLDNGTELTATSHLFTIR